MSTLKKLEISEVEFKLLSGYELLRKKISTVSIYQNLFRKLPSHFPW